MKSKTELKTEKSDCLRDDEKRRIDIE